MLIRSWPARIVATFGVYSYCIYLWHQEASYVIGRLGTALPGLPEPVGWLLLTSAYDACAFLVGWVMSRLVEKLALAFRDRTFRSRAVSAVSMQPDSPRA